MTEQLDLLGGPPVPLERPVVTEKQRAVLLELRRFGRLDSDEAGAILHELKEGRWAHPRDSRCDWCGRDGRAMLEALVHKGFAERKRPGGRQLQYHALIPDPDPLAGDADFAEITVGSATTAPPARDGRPGPGGFPDGF